MDTSTEEQWQQGPSLLQSIWRYRLLVVAVAVLTGGAGYWLSSQQATMYEASASMVLTDPRNVGVFADTPRRQVDPVRYLSVQAERITSTPVLTRTSELVGGRLAPAEISEAVTAQAAVDLDMVVVYAAAPTAEGAAELANAAAEAYQQVAAEEAMAQADAAIAQLSASRASVQERIDQIEAALAVNPGDVSQAAQLEAATQQLVAFDTRIEELSVEAALYGAGVDLYEPAQTPEWPARPRPRRDAAMAGVLGVGLAGAFAWWRAGRSQSADSRDDPAAILGAPLLGEIPKFKLPRHSGPLPALPVLDAVTAEAYHFVVSSLEFALAESGASSLVVTSAAPGDGKTVTALNLAMAAARDGRRVVLVDGDGRARGLSGMVGADDGRGLVDLADDALAFEQGLRSVDVDELELPFVPVGSELDDPAGFFRTPAFRKAVQRVKERADLVVVDTPPLLAVSDTSAIAGQVDGIVVVVDRGTPVEQLRAIRERLAFVGTPLLGYVFNRSEQRGGAYAYGYPKQQRGRSGGRRAGAGARREREKTSVY